MEDEADAPRPRIHEHTPCGRIGEMVTHWVVALPKGTTIGPFNSCQGARAWVEEWLTEDHQRVCLIPVLSPAAVGDWILKLPPLED